MLAWPSRAWMTFGSVPSSAKSDPQLGRRSFNRMCGSFAFVSSLAKCRCVMAAASRERPLGPAKTNASAGGTWPSRNLCRASEREHEKGVERVRLGGLQERRRLLASQAHALDVRPFGRGDASGDVGGNTSLLDGHRQAAVHFSQAPCSRCAARAHSPTARSPTAASGPLSVRGAAPLTGRGACRGGLRARRWARIGSSPRERGWRPTRSGVGRKSATTTSLPPAQPLRTPLRRRRSHLTGTPWRPATEAVTA
jgi:hypothetical protein